MPERRSASNTIYLEAKHYCLWQSIKEKVEGCDTIQVTNPKTGVPITKHGYIYDNVTGRVTKVEKYDTGDKFTARYFGFKLHMVEANGQKISIDMPYNSMILRRFLHVAPAIDWAAPLFISVFKGDTAQGAGEPSTGVWFKQFDATIKPYYTKENLHGMPEATKDDFGKWDFTAQHRWLVSKLKEDIMPKIDEVNAAVSQQPANNAPGGDDEGPGNNWDEEEIPF